MGISVRGYAVKGRVFSAVLLAAGPVLAAGGGGNSCTAVDPAGDATPRLTDDGADGLFNSAALPDLLELTISAWGPTNPSQDPYTGTTVDRETADMFRIDLVLDGLINPPGPLGLGAAPWDPFRYGDRPVYGFIELDLDRERDTGGELGSAAKNRYLANVGRMARRPYGSIGDRIAIEGTDLDGAFFSMPQYERSGAEFDFGFCGCFDTQLVSETGNADGTMDAGETFIVRGRFFRRVAAFLSVSGMEGGSFGGLYDPMVEVRFAHDPALDRTTVTFVGALTMAGAAALTGEPQQFEDFLVDNHWSVAEAVSDIIEGALGFNGPISPEVQVLIEGWETQSSADYLDPTRWRTTALLGTTYATSKESLFIWTDTGFDEAQADYTGDGLADGLDLAALDAHVASLDGGLTDADGVVNGELVVVNPGPGFDAFDITGDGHVDAQDRAFFATADPADFDGSGSVDGADLAMLLAAWGNPGPTDLNSDGVTNGGDLAILLASWG